MPLIRIEERTVEEEVDFLAELRSRPAEHVLFGQDNEVIETAEERRQELLAIDEQLDRLCDLNPRSIPIYIRQHRETEETIAEAIKKLLPNYGWQQ